MINWKSEKENLKKYLEEGKTYKEINEIYGIKNAKDRVYKSGLTNLYNPEKNRVWEKDRNKLIKLLFSGKSYKDISKVYGISADIIKRIVLSLEIDKYYSHKKVTIWRKEINNLISYLSQGKTLTEISKIYKVSVTNIHYVVKDLNLSKLLIKKKKKDIVKKKIIDKHKPKRKIYTNICLFCGNKFSSEHKNQKYCSGECAHKSQRKVPEKDILLKQLDDNGWNYSAVGRLNGVSDNAIKKKIKSLNLYTQKINNWSDVVDLESAQFKIDSLGIKTASELHRDYGGLADRMTRLNLLNKLVYPGTEFDSSWEDRLYNYIISYSDTLGYTSISHNIILNHDCKYIRPLIFDIVLDYGENAFKIVIEIQGPSHFKDIHSDGSFQSQLKRDEIKYNYCIDHNINILYFTYDENLIKIYGYPHYVYTEESLLLEKLKEFSSPKA